MEFNAFKKPPTSPILDIGETLKQRDYDEFEKRQLQMQKDFFDLHVRVREHMGWSDVETKDWFYQKNTKLGNFTPLDYYGKQPERCIRWIDTAIQDGVDL